MDVGLAGQLEQTGLNQKQHIQIHLNLYCNCTETMSYVTSLLGKEYKVFHCLSRIVSQFCTLFALLINLPLWIYENTLNTQ